jgi:hypothetical protein
MNATTENSTEKSLERISSEKPVSVYSVNFERVINNFSEKSFISKRKADSGKIAVQNRLSKKIFKWRNAVAVAAILAIGVLHFAFQMSFISREISKNRPLLEVPPVKIEPLLRAAPVEIPPTEFKIKKINAPLSQRSAAAIRQRKAEIALPKPPPKKKDAFESRAERLRRVERILTGV